VTVGTGGDEVEVRVPLAVAGAKGSELKDREQIDALRAYLEQAMEGRLVPPWVRERPKAYEPPKEGEDPHKAFAGGLKFRVAIADPGDALTAPLLQDVLARRMPYSSTVEGGRRTKEPADKIDRSVEVAAVAA